MKLGMADDPAGCVGDAVEAGVLDDVPAPADESTEGTAEVVVEVEDTPVGVAEVELGAEIEAVRVGVAIPLTEPLGEMVIAGVLCTATTSRGTVTLMSVQVPSTEKIKRMSPVGPDTAMELKVTTELVAPTGAPKTS